MFPGDAESGSPMLPPMLMMPGSLHEIQMHFIVGIAEQVQHALPTQVLVSLHRGESFWQAFGKIIWSLIIWMPVTLMLIRQGALLTAGRSLMGFTSALKLAGQRSLVGWLIAVVPLVCVGVISVGIIVLGWISRLSGSLGAWLEFPVGLLIAVVAVVCGVLAFGGNFAVPLGWAALVNEREPDPLDSLSRGYEYLYRRPLQLAMYFLVALACMLVVTYLSQMIMIAGMAISDLMIGIAGGGESIQAIAQEFLVRLPLVVAITLFWALVGGVYLLLRQDAGGQEVEDIWQPSEKPPAPLPELPVS